MILAAIINYWADTYELLPHCVNSARKWADCVIVVWSTTSNYKEVDLRIPDLPGDVHVFNWEPRYHNSRDNETAKRNFGLDQAAILQCTHFVTMDADEFYDPDQVNAARAMFNNDINGIVVSCQTYFAKPWLTIGLDTTLVPFIHRITPGLRHEFNRKYPCAWERGQIRIDPTRSLNINSGVIFIPKIVMHHFSYVRKDLRLKIRNSSARINIEKSSAIEDYKNAQVGSYCGLYGKNLSYVDNIFEIPDIYDSTV